MIIRQTLTTFCAAAAIFAGTAAAAYGPGDIVKPNLEQTIPNLPGKSLVAVEVEYPPPASLPVSRNASKTQPAKLLAIFVVDTNDKELTTPLT